MVRLPFVARSLLRARDRSKSRIWEQRRQVGSPRLRSNASERAGCPAKEVVTGGYPPDGEALSWGSPSVLSLVLSSPKMPRQAVLTLSSPRAWGLILAPVRFEMIEAMRMVAPCSIAQVAEILDRPADSLYRHMNKLVVAGVVVKSGVRRKGRHSEQIYDLVADDIAPSFAGMTPRQAHRIYHGTMSTIAKIITRTSRDAIREKELVMQEGPFKTAAFLEHAWLTPEDLAEFRSLVMAVKSFLDARKTPGNGRLYVTTAVAMPVTRKRRARQRDAADAVKAPAPKRPKRSARAKQAGAAATRKAASAKRAPSRRAKR